MSISFKIRVTDATVETEYPINICTRVKRNYISFRKKVSNKDTQIAYLEANKIISNEAISLRSFFDKFTRKYDSGIFSTKESVIISSKPNLIFTTVTSGSETGKVPMFYGHKFPSNAGAISFDAWNKINNSATHVINQKYNFIFSLLENEVNVKNKIYNCSYVKYFIENTGFITEIYRQEPLFREASYYDINPETLSLDTNAPVYWKERLIDGSWKYTINKSPEDTVYYKEEESLRPGIRLIAQQDTSKPWPISLTNSAISYNGVDYNFKENNNFIWFPSYGFRTLKKEAEYINEKSILLPNKRVLVDIPKNCHLTLKVIRDNKIFFIKTTKEFLVGKRVVGYLSEDNLVRYEAFKGSVDFKNGVVTLRESLPLKSTDRIVVEYVTMDLNGEQEIANVNPTQQPLMEDLFLLIAASPTTSNISQDSSEIIKFFFKKVYKNFDPTSDKIETNLILKDVNREELSDLIGKDINFIIENYLAFDPYSNERESPIIVSNLYNYLPLAFVSFLKEKYSYTVKQKDLRVFSGIKDDYKLHKMGKDFVFSKLLNPNGTYTLDLFNNLAVYVDREEIPNYDNLDIVQTINNLVTVSSFPHIIYTDEPKILFITNYKVEEIPTINALVAEKQEIKNTLCVYKAASKDDYSSSDSIIFFDHIDRDYNEEAEYPELSYKYKRDLLGNYYFSIPIPEEHIPENGEAFYLYFKWAEGNIDDAFNDLKNFSGPSSIYCIKIKD